MGDFDVCTEFEMLKVKVPIIFLGTVGFSSLREGRYHHSRGHPCYYSGVKTIQAIIAEV